jgi:hypothetical protein
MKPKVGRMKTVVWLGVACLGLRLSPLSAQEPKLRAILKGHTSPVWCVAYSPDGRWLVSGSGPTIQLATPGGKTPASGSGDKTVKLWDMQTGKERATFKGHSSLVSSVAFSPDAKLLASGSHDKTVKLWDVQKGKEQATLKGHAAPVLSVAFSPDGKTLASGSSDETIKLWDVQTGREPVTLRGHSRFIGSVWSVAYSPDGRRREVEGFTEAFQGAEKEQMPVLGGQRRGDGDERPKDQAAEDQRLAAEAVAHDAGKRQGQGVHHIAVIFPLPVTSGTTTWEVGEWSRALASSWSNIHVGGLASSPLGTGAAQDDEQLRHDLVAGGAGHVSPARPA